MSAFLCDDYTFSYIVQAGIQYKAWVQFGGEYGYLDFTKAQHVFEVLKRENLRSLNYRYKEDSDKESKNLGYRCIVRGITPIQAIKAIHCLEYQSCEHPEWETSLAKKLCDSIQSACIRKVDGYEKAEWGVTDPRRKVTK